MANIAFYGSHNAAIAVEENGQLITVIEVERFLSKKNAGYGQYSIAYSRQFLIQQILDFIRCEYGITEYDTCYHLNSDTLEHKTIVHYEKLIPAKNYIDSWHHLSHAACGFYQTNFKEALIISFDGGGNDGYFNIYHAKNRKTITLLKKYNLDLGFPYMSFGEYLADIRKESTLSIGNLVYSGKIMGLCSYGKLNQIWLPHFENYYRQQPNGSNYKTLLENLGDKIDLTFDTKNRFTGQTAWDISMTSQVAFENVFMDIAQPYIEQFNHLPLILVGGCALNILLNTKLKKELNQPVFIPPNPNDCGIACGMILNHIQPKKAIDITYAGIPILDRYTLMSHVEERWAKKLNLSELVQDLKEGNIVGVVRNNSEHGPRALGNRSIICNPTFPDMKKILNERVKNREWYRPFAPVCRQEDVSKYFDFEGESRWMSFCPTVKKAWRKKLTAITHVDHTARVQTVTQQQNPWLYELLTIFEKATGIGVLLNTSFNINGKPILSRYSDALEVFDHTKMDRLLLEDFYFER